MSEDSLPNWITVSPEVQRARKNRTPLVALESSVITHGLPRPSNLDLARRVESEVLAIGAQPATIALLDGKVCLGLTANELERLAGNERAEKISRRDLAGAVAFGLSGGTTVAATMIVAHAAGVRVFATGGIGGFHRGESGDVSADLPELARTPVAVVSSGAKSILDLPRTLEWLETAGVPVVGLGTRDFPAFFSRASGLPVSTTVETVQEAASLLRTHWSMGLRSGVLITVPCPEAEAVPNAQVEAALGKAEAEARSVGISGRELTPFLLSRLAELTRRATLRANLALLRQNARVAATLALALA